MSYYLQASSSSYIEVKPEYDFDLGGKKIEDRQRARSGREYVYKWGVYASIKFSLRYLTNSHRTVINSWWGGNTALLFNDTTASQVYSVRIANDTMPISKVEKPYQNYWAGIVELETY